MAAQHFFSWLEIQVQWEHTKLDYKFKVINGGAYVLDLLRNYLQYA